ncbi:hypothetical protein [Streptosporangium sp. LJ11]|uniref:hypothetical protein n=1 Tax=Streptosporangium sp. LJ11 TaxID=3436927 RepID=UPI003F7AC633
MSRGDLTAAQWAALGNRPAARRLLQALLLGMESVMDGSAPDRPRPGTGGAAATPGEPAPTPANNCVVDVIGGLDEPGTEHCFPTFTEAIRFATDDAVTDAPPTAVEGVDDPVLDALLGRS